MYTVYSKPACQHCEKAKALLTQRAERFNVVHVDVGQAREPEAEYISLAEFKGKYPTQKSLPLILKDGAVIGGFTELSRSFAA